MAKAPRPTKEEAVALAERRRRVADLYVQGWRQADIGVRLGIDQGTVSRDLKTIQKEWAEQRVSDIDELKREQLEKIDRVEREAWDGWVRSQKPTRTKEDSEKPKRTTKTTAGDPRFLLIVDRCIERRSKIVGLEAPQKHANTDSQGNDLPTPQRGRSEFDGLFAALRKRGGVQPTAPSHSGNGSANGSSDAGGLPPGSAN